MLDPLVLPLIALVPVASLIVAYLIVVGIQSWLGIRLLPFHDTAE